MSPKQIHRLGLIVTVLAANRVAKKAAIKKPRATKGDYSI